MRDGCLIKYIGYLGLEDICWKESLLEGWEVVVDLVVLSMRVEKVFELRKWYFWLLLFFFKFKDVCCCICLIVNGYLKYIDVIGLLEDLIGVDVME